MNTEQVIIILIAAVVGIVNWMSKRQQEGGSDQEPSEPVFRPPQTPSDESERERMRKFMEALGVPASSLPPSPVQRKIQPRPAQEQVPAAPAPRTSAPPMAPRQPQMRRTAPVSTKPVPMPAPPVTPEVPQPAKYEVDLHEQVSLRQAVAVEKAPVASARLDLASLPALLRKPESLRAAFVLKEILGTPRGLETTWGR